ncbi:MAG TPA: group III truncated hemoglobin [Opitutaceae bacterium]|nr:group III truncated hemoglobin [Opitutaceae bacterium]
MTTPTTLSLYDRIGGRETLRVLLRSFYAELRQHREMGRLLVRHVADWPAHLEKIADFWSGAIGGPMRDHWATASKHLSLGLREEHFATWLGLWERHCRARLAAPEAAEMICCAQAIGQRLQEIGEKLKSGKRK